MSKFQVGEIAELFCADDVWRECEILETPDDSWRTIGSGNLPPGKYLVYCPGFPSPHVTGRWCSSEKDLRKRRPPGADIVREFMHELPREVMA